MRAICPGAFGDAFVNFPDGATDYELARYGCRAAAEEETPGIMDFVATGL